MSQHFGWGKLIRFVLPSIATMIFTSIYGIVDGLFISNFAGKTSFAAVNFIMPMVMILSTSGFMVGSGGSAIVGKTRGEGDDAKANRQFSLFVIFAFALGVVLMIIGMFIAYPVAQAMGATGDMLDEAALYGRIVLISLPFFALQYVFQSFFVTAGKPRLGFVVTVIAGVMNMFLDFLFVGVFGWGVVGAAVATNISEILGGAIPIIYFLRPNSSALRLCKTHLNWGEIGHACINGSSELMTNIAVSVVSILYNIQLLILAGENGVSAFGVCMYVSMIFSAIFMGYCMGSAPLMSFQYGARNTHEMQNLLKKGVLFVAIGGIAMFAASQASATLVADAFAGYDEGLHEMTEHAFRLQSIAFALMGYSMYASSLFTALGNGLVSAFISFIRTLVFEIAAIYLLPLVLGVDGLWLAWPTSELLAMGVSAVLVLSLGNNYGILPPKKQTMQYSS